jgi:hypothetical protein
MGRFGVLLVLISLASACGGCDEVAGDNGEANGAPGDDVRHDASDTEWGDTDANGGQGGDVTPSDDASNDGGDLDTGGDPDAEIVEPAPEPERPHEGCVNRYQRKCEDVCTNVKVDPDNCGDCGVVCGEGQACSGGACAETCIGSEQICDRTCVDTSTSNAHCGACGQACPDGTGCNNGVCVPALRFEAPESCADGGEAVDFEVGDDEGRCAGDVAEETFRWALCACSRTRLQGGLYTDAFDSSQGPYVPGVLGGGVGVNNELTCTASFDVGGAVWVGANNELSLQSTSKVHLDLNVGGRASLNGRVDVLEDANIGGRIITGGSPVHVQGTLTVPEGISIGSTQYGNLVRAPVTVPNPCKCEPDEIIPIAALVNHRRDHNDNALIGLAANALVGSTIRRLDLPCGSYYLSGINAPDDITIVAHGRTALYIGGDVSAKRLVIQASPDAELDVHIVGNLQITQGFTFGNPHFPAATRLYLGGTGGLQVTQNVDIGGFVYSYPGRIHITDNVTIYGGVFANEVTVTQSLRIHYDRQILRAGESCDPDPTPDPMPDPDPGMDAGFPDADPRPDTGPGPDPDPGNQCVGFEDRCTVDADCCAPLVCDRGRCALARCVGANESCVYNSDCCSGICASTGSGSFCVVN